MLKKIVPLSFLLVFYQIEFAQQKYPVLESDSTTVYIKIDGSQVGVWNVDADTRPGNEPDVLKLERSFHERKITYKSNRDSISFNVKPGDTYYFTILINDKRAFPMGVTTFDEPWFLHWNLMVLVFATIIITAIITYIKRKSLSTKALLYAGIAAPLLFWAATITGGFIHGNYNHLQHVVSELGAIGTSSEIFMSTTETMLFILSSFSVIGFYRSCKKIGVSTIPVLTILSLSVSMWWAATFPMHHELHGAIGPIPLLLNLGALLSIFLWRRKDFNSLRWISFVSFVLMSLIALRAIPDIRNNYEGMAQRFFYLGWTIWSISLSLIFVKLAEDKYEAAQ